MASYRIVFGIVALYLSSLTCLCAATVLDNLQESFKPPAISYGPHVFYHRVNGYIRKAALEEDIEVMLKAGLGIPQGRIEYESDKWLDLDLYSRCFQQKGPSCGDTQCAWLLWYWKQKSACQYDGERAGMDGNSGS